MRYTMARYSEKQREIAYRIYLTDSLYYMGQQKYISIRYVDMVHAERQPDVDGDAIVESILGRAGLRQGGSQ